MRALLSWLPILVIALLFWLILIRPAQRRQAATVALQRQVSVGDDVVLTSGIYGTVTEVADDHLGIEVAEGLTLRVVRGAIGSKVHSDEPDEAAEPGEADDLTDTTDDRDVVDGED